MKELIIATKNKGKVNEFKAILEPKGYKIISLIDFPSIPEIEESGLTFAENASIKAIAMARHFQMPVIADDSGLIVDALEGRPGIYSARYAGVDKNDDANNEKVLNELKGVPFEQRTARFHCAIAVAFPTEEVETFVGSCEGLIGEELAGENGFGYDPLFYIPEYGKTFAELSSEEKNKISHRAIALKKLEENWERLF